MVSRAVWGDEYKRTVGGLGRRAQQETRSLGRPGWVGTGSRGGGKVFEATESGGVKKEAAGCVTKLAECAGLRTVFTTRGVPGGGTVCWQVRPVGSWQMLGIRRVIQCLEVRGDTEENKMWRSFCEKRP